MQKRNKYLKFEAEVRKMEDNSMDVVQMTPDRASSDFVEPAYSRLDICPFWDLYTDMTLYCAYNNCFINSRYTV